MNATYVKKERGKIGVIVRIIVQIIVAIILISIGISVIFMSKEKPNEKPVEILARQIRYIQAEKTSVNLSIGTQGSVMSKQHINITPQVSGEVTYVSEKFVAGGRFKKGETILKIDPRDYEVAVISAESHVVSSEQALAREQAESQLAKTEWAALGDGEPSDLTLRVPQLKEAQANLKASEADLKRAELNLERATLRAPFDGLLGEKSVDYGQFVNSGTTVGSFYSTSVLEVRLPLANRDLSQIDLVALQNGRKIPVTLTGNFANVERVWTAQVVRTEGLIDQKSRILYVVAELKGEELFSHDGMRLNIGQFVKAQISGKHYDNVIKLPRSALRQNNQILVVDSDNKLRTKIVNVLESNDEYIIASGGVQPGDIVNLSQLGISVDGLLVRTENTLTDGKVASQGGSSSLEEAAHE